ncbi:uncharacterized protein LOC132731601 [Ruditapes philippinarum]|uniref:uncharacterized protein LOC132731601 n=1 Tax=Ruditapes philippinarum TaxID=129788 RepID=UPI00295B520E|nr:uncharacterized protein LOC132731601 [Ruditapes philippinarum]
MPMGRKRKGADSPSASTHEEAFTKKSWTEDLTLVVEGKKMYVSKAVLALASPVFTRMFESDFAEKHKEEIELKDKKYGDVVEFLQSIYPSTRKPVAIENVFQILPLADEYQVESLRKDCEQCLLQELTLKFGVKCCVSICRYLQQAALYGLEKLEEKCIEVLRDKPQRDIDIGENSYPLPLECKNKLLIKINMQLEENIKSANEKIEQLKKEKRNLKTDLELYKSKLVFDAKSEQERIVIEAVAKNRAEEEIEELSWTLKAEKFIEDGKTYLSAWVSFEPDRPHMMCFADGTFTLLAKDKKNLEWFLKDVTFSSVSFTWGCQKLIEWKDFIDPDNGYVNEDKAMLQVFMMIHDPHEA